MESHASFIDNIVTFIVLLGVIRLFDRIRRTKYLYSLSCLWVAMKVRNPDYTLDKVTSCDGCGLPGNLRRNTWLCIAHPQTPTFQNLCINGRVVQLDWVPWITSHLDVSFYHFFRRGEDLDAFFEIFFCLEWCSEVLM